jgi:hypothetical protein
LRPLRIDFVRATAPLPWLGWTLLAFSLAVSGLLVADHRAARLELARIQDHARGAGAVARPASTGRGMAAEIETARALTAQLALPWGPLFQAVESAATARVALLALQPDGDQGVIRITAETRDLDDALEFVRRLSETRLLGAVHLDSHQVQAENRLAPLRFTVIAGVPKGPRS